MPLSKKDQRQVRKQLRETEERARTAIENEESEAMHTNITAAYNELKKENENAFVMVNAPVAPQVAANRFGLFSIIISSAKHAASYLNPFAKNS